MKIQTISILSAAAILLAGCGKKSDSSDVTPTENHASAVSPLSPSVQPQSPQTAFKPIKISEWDKVKISDSGDIFVNKKQMSLAEFSAECQRLKQAGGAALIYTGDMPHLLSPAQTEAIQKLTVAGVPMKIALKESELD
jgi:hypothetical protein